MGYDKRVRKYNLSFMSHTSSIPGAPQKSQSRGPRRQVQDTDLAKGRPSPGDIHKGNRPPQGGNHGRPSPRGGRASQSWN